MIEEDDFIKRGSGITATIDNLVPRIIEVEIGLRHLTTLITKQGVFLEKQSVLSDRLLLVEKDVNTLQRDVKEIEQLVSVQVNNLRKDLSDMNVRIDGLEKLMAKLMGAAMLVIPFLTTILPFLVDKFLK